MPILMTILILLLSCSSATALTIDEAVANALSNHQRIEEYQARTEQQAAAVGSARSGFLPSVTMDYSYIDRDDDPYDYGEKNSTLELAVSLNLFNGMRDRYRYSAAQDRQQGALLQLKGTKADIQLEARQAYIGVLRARRATVTAQEGVTLLERQYRDTALKFEHGMIARNDLLRVEVELSSAKQQLLRAQGEERKALYLLERVMDTRLSEHETLLEVDDANLPMFKPTEAENYFQELKQQRSELLYLTHQLKAARNERKANRGGYLPSVDLEASHVRYGDELSPLDRDEDDNLLTLTASWTLFDGLARESAIDSAAAQMRVINAQLRDTEATLQLQLEQALQNNLIARGRETEARSAVISAEENYRVTEDRLQHQQATTVDLLDASYLLTRSRNEELNARYDLQLSIFELERILERGM